MMVCLEGVDLCGKGTQTRLLADALQAKVFKFPDAKTEVGELIYEHLDRKWRATYGDRELMDSKLDAIVFQALQTMNRLEHAEELEAYARTYNPKWAVLDRYWPSGVVFGGADGLNHDWLVKIHSSLPQPHFFILLDIEYVDVQARMRDLKRPADRYESDDRVKDRIARYRKLWAERPGSAHNTWITVNAAQPAEKVLAAIIHQLRVRGA